MAVDGVNNGGNFDWSKALGEAFKQSGLSELSDESPITFDGNNVTITVRDPLTGEPIQKTMALPELNPDTLEEDVANFLLEFADLCDEIVEYLKDLARETGEPEPTPDGGDNTPVDDETKGQGVDTPNEKSNAQKTLFSIYELINMMQDIAQTQRNNARAIRYQELEMQVTSIENQAEYQRNAALYGMIVSCCTAAVQIGMTVGSTVSAVKGIQKMDTCSAGQDLNQAKGDAKTLDAAKNGKIDERIAELEGKCTDAEKGEVNAALDGCKDQKAALDAAQEELNDAKGVFSKFEKQAQELDSKIKELEGVKEPKPEQTKELETLKKQREDLKPTLESAKKELGKFEAKFDDAKKAYIGALDKAMADMDAKYNEASQAAKDAEANYVDKFSAKHPLDNRSNYKAMTEAQDAQKSLGNQRQLLQAKIAQEKANIGELPSEQDISAANLKEQVAQNAMKTDKGYQLALANPAASGLYTQLVQTVGSVGQSLAHFVQTNIESKATEEGARQKEDEQFRDETNQLFQQAQDLVNNVRSLLQAVIQAEAHSTEQIIQG